MKVEEQRTVASPVDVYRHPNDRSAEDATSRAAEVSLGTGHCMSFGFAKSKLKAAMQRIN